MKVSFMLLHKIISWRKLWNNVLTCVIYKTVGEKEGTRSPWQSCAFSTIPETHPAWRSGNTTVIYASVQHRQSVAACTPTNRFSHISLILISSSPKSIKIVLMSYSSLFASCWQNWNSLWWWVGVGGDLYLVWLYLNIKCI